MKYVDKLPKCSFADDWPHPNGTDAYWDAPTVKGSWAHMCEDCYYRDIGIPGTGTQFKLRTKKVEAAPEPVQGIERRDDKYWAEILMDLRNRKIQCPQCQESVSVEPDGSGSYVCGGCKSRVLYRKGPGL